MSRQLFLNVFSDLFVVQARIEFWRNNLIQVYRVCDGCYKISEVFVIFRNSRHSFPTNHRFFLRKKDYLRIQRFSGIQMDYTNAETFRKASKFLEETGIITNFCGS